MPDTFHLDDGAYRITRNQGRGNCFFLALAQAMGFSEADHGAMRDAVCTYLSGNLQLFAQHPPVGEECEEFVGRMRHNGIYAEGALIEAAAVFYNRPIRIIMIGNAGEGTHIKMMNAEASGPLITLLLSYQHYELLTKAPLLARTHHQSHSL